jgi:hypothetical protein
MHRLLLLALVACSSHDLSGDPAVGRWRGETKTTIELRADGSLDMPPVPSIDCEDATAVIKSCAEHERWSRIGSTVTLERAAISRKPGVPMTSPGPCECRYERVEVQLRGDELIAGKDHAQRVVAPKPAKDPAP